MRANMHATVRTSASVPKLAVAVNDRRVSQRSAELCVGVANAMGERNLSQVSDGSGRFRRRRAIVGRCVCVNRAYATRRSR